jgi:aminoglycoside 3-N-acetyltransferase I
MDSRNYQIRRLRADNPSAARQLFVIMQEIFGEPPAQAGESHVEKLLQNPAFVVLAVFYNGEIIGGLTAYELPMYYADVAELYIYDIAVKPPFQRMGVGKRLLDTIKAYCREVGIKLLFVDASEADKDALDFYRGMGAAEEKVIQFTYLSM